MSDLSVDFLQPPPHFYVLFMAFTPQPPSVDVCLIIRLNHQVPQWTNLTTGGLDDLESICYRLVINSLLNGEFGNGQDVHGSGRAAPQIPDQIENYLQTRQVLILEAKWHCTTSKNGRIMF